MAIENQQEKESELIETLKKSFKEEEEEIIKITNDFYVEIEKRFKIKEKSRLSTFDENEREILKMKNDEIEFEDIFMDYQILPRRFNMKQIQFLSKELTEQELVSLIQLQNSVQQKKIQERKKIVKNEKEDVKEDEDPLFTLLNLKTFQYLTVEQKLFYKLKFNEIYNKKIENWKSELKKKQQLTISPKILKNHFNSMKNLPKMETEKNEKFIPNWSLKEWSDYLKINQNLTNSNSLNDQLFPEKPWEGDFQTLQVKKIQFNFFRCCIFLYN